MSLDQVAEASRRSIEVGSKSFAGAARLLPPGIRASAHMLYAWCRYCDDVIDGQEFGHGAEMVDAADARSRLDRLRDETRRALDGRSVTLPAFVAFQRVMADHAIPAVHAFELLDGFAMDVEGRRYDTIEDTLDYCYHVAGVVGLMMARIMGVTDPATLGHACDLGLGFQLTNIARDVVDDAALGRVYLPSQWLDAAGLTAGSIAEADSRPALARVVGRLLDASEPYYESALQGIGQLPARSAFSIAVARAVYRDIGIRVRQRGAAAWDSRTSLSGGRKLALALGAMPLTMIEKGRRRRRGAP